MSETTYAASSRTKYILVAVVVVLAFFAAYGIASGRADASSQTAIPATTANGSGTAAACDPAADLAACGGDCCESGSSELIEGSATLEGDVQKLYVDVSGGSFDPNVIYVKAGVPIELTFSEGSGCMAEVMFKDFGVYESLTSGGAAIELPALEVGEYGFSCGMEMVFGTLIAE